MLRILVLLCLTTPALAQQLPPLDPAMQLGVCQAQRARFLSDSEQAQTYATQFLAEIADLKKKLAEAEAKLPKTEVHPEAQPQ
ncbi:MAG TPA: hypothetical protein VNH83_14935 [Bryobacteraceae bacterium]|nr:hypothetical protein [Bryobacteraceae bacterium]